MVPGEMNMEREGVVEVRERDAILCTQRLTNDDLIDVIKLIPILVPVIISHVIIINCPTLHIHTAPLNFGGYS